MLSTAEDIISSGTIAAGDGREVASAVAAAAIAAAAVAAASNTTTASHSHTLQFVIGQLRRHDHWKSPHNTVRFRGEKKRKKE